MKRRGFFGAALAGIVGVVVAVKGQGVRSAPALPDDVPGPIRADVTPEERAAFREAWEYWRNPPMVVTPFYPTTTGGANSNDLTLPITSWEGNVGTSGYVQTTMTVGSTPTTMVDASQLLADHLRSYGADPLQWPNVSTFALANGAIGAVLVHPPDGPA